MSYELKSRGEEILFGDNYHYQTPHPWPEGQEHGPKPVAEQKAEWVDRAFLRRSTRVETVFLTKFGGELHNQSHQLEVMSVDSRREEEKNNPDIPMIVNFTGAWGRGPEVEAELRTMALAMGEKGLCMDMVSLPGHGLSEDLPQGWDDPEAFSKVAELMIAYIEKQKQAFPNQPVLLNSWSMGGVTALKIAAMRPDLVDGIILIDTPIFRQNAYKTLFRFLMYPTQGFRRGEHKTAYEEKLPYQTKFKGLGVFKDRIAQQNKPEGMPLKSVVWKSAQELCRQDLVADGTLQKVADEGIPMLLMVGHNDWVIRRPLIERLHNFVRMRQQGTIQFEEIPQSGHSVVDERPQASAAAIGKWLEGAFKTAQQKRKNPDSAPKTTIGSRIGSLFKS